MGCSCHVHLIDAILLKSGNQPGQVIGMGMGHDDHVQLLDRDTFQVVHELRYPVVRPSVDQNGLSLRSLYKNGVSLPHINKVYDQISI